MKITGYVEKIIASLLFFLSIGVCFVFEHYDYVRYVCIFTLAVYIVCRKGIIKVAIDKRFSLFFMLLCFFCLFLILGSYKASDLVVMRNPFYSAIVFSVSVLIFFIIHVGWALYDEVVRETKQLLIISFLYCIIMDCTILFLPHSLRKNEYYLVGTKFQVAYFHITFIAFLFVRLFICKTRRQVLAILISYVVSVIVIIKVDCKTGLVGIVLFSVMLFVSMKRPRFFLNPISYTVVLVISCSFFPIYRYLIRYSVVQTFIVNVLQRDLTLSTRTIIYDRIANVLKERLFWGYGFGSSYEICMARIGAPNSQNGFIDWVLQAGLAFALVLVCIFILIYYMVNKNIKKMDLNGIKLLAPINSLIFTYTILASVEITIDINYFFLVSLLLGLSVNLKHGNIE